MELECSVVGCSNLAQKPFKTCSIASCRALEDTYDIRKTAMFQLQRRLPNFKDSYIKDSYGPLDPISRSTSSTAVGIDDAGFMEGNVDADFSDDELGEDDKLISAANPAIPAPAPPAAGKNRTQFGRRRTHNEQLCVGSCGIVVGRKTFFGSEGIENVLVSLCYSGVYLRVLTQHRHSGRSSSQHSDQSRALCGSITTAR
jgi:hypothetical protein